MVAFRCWIVKGRSTHNFYGVLICEEGMNQVSGLCKGMKVHSKKNHEWGDDNLPENDKFPHQASSSEAPLFDRAKVRLEVTGKDEEKRCAY